VQKDEQQNRTEALQNAVRHRLKEETADNVVESAEKYFKFLQGDSSTVPSPGVSPSVV